MVDLFPQRPPGMRSVYAEEVLVVFGGAGLRFELAVLLALVAGAAGWMFRYAYLPPVVYQDTPTAGTHGRSVVVCKVDRWTAYTTCERVIVDLEEIAKDMARWAKEHEKK